MDLYTGSRLGPDGFKTLCNRCGLRWKRSPLNKGAASAIKVSPRGGVAAVKEVTSEALRKQQIFDQAHSDETFARACLVDGPPSPAGLKNDGDSLGIQKNHQ